MLCLLLLSSVWLSAERASHPHQEQVSGSFRALMDMWLVGACALSQETLCVLSVLNWLPGMTRSVIDKFIHMATRRGGRPGHFCFLAELFGLRLHLL